MGTRERIIARRRELQVPDQLQEQWVTLDLLARSELCHLHDGCAEAESCAIDPKLQASRSGRRARGAGRIEPARVGGPPVAVRDHQRPSAPEV